MKRRTRRIKDYEAVAYEPVTVLELLTEMKDVSELMTDLAYSALILDSDPIGEQVDDLAARMDWLKYHLRLQASLAVRNPDEAEQVAGILQVADASEHIANAAADLVDLLDQSVNLRPFLGRVLDEADDRISTATIPDGSPAIGQNLGELDLEAEMGLRVLAVRRAQKGWRYAPGKSTQLHAGDTLLVRGQQESAANFRDFLRGAEVAP